MADRIVIEGSMIRHVRETLISEAPLESLSQHLVTRLPTIFPVLPSAGPTRYIGFDPNTQRGLMIVEVAPRTRSIQVRHASGQYPDDEARAGRSAVGTFRVNFPFSYFVFPFRTSEQTDGALTNFTIGNTALYWRKEPFRDAATDQFYIAQCPNIDTAGGICWGGTINPEGSLSAHVDAMINEFFTTQFNEDLGHRTPFGHSLIQWEDDSQTPLSYLGWPMFGTRGLGQTIENIWNTWAHNRAPIPNMAELNPAFVDIPELPQNFTVLRARQWLDTLPAQTRTRFVAALELSADEAAAPA